METVSVTTTKNFVIKGKEYKSFDFIDVYQLKKKIKRKKMNKL